jgi:hypothetical protein
MGHLCLVGHVHLARKHRRRHQICGRSVQRITPGRVLGPVLRQDGHDRFPEQWGRHSCLLRSTHPACMADRNVCPTCQFRLGGPLGRSVRLVGPTQRVDCRDQHEANQVQYPENAASQGDPVKKCPSRGVTHLNQQSGNPQHHTHSYRQEDTDENERHKEARWDLWVVHGLVLPVFPILRINRAAVKTTLLPMVRTSVGLLRLDTPRNRMTMMYDCLHGTGEVILCNR